MNLALLSSESKENGFAKYLTGKTGSVTLNTSKQISSHSSISGICFV